MAPIRTMEKKIEGEIAGKNKEDPYPEREVQKAVVDFIPFSLDDLFHELRIKNEELRGDFIFGTFLLVVFAIKSALLCPA
jgi:hypothetical protein